MLPVPESSGLSNAQVAQLVEQRTENPRVGGSIPPLGTTFFRIFPGSQPVLVVVN